MTSETVRLEIKDNVAHLILARPGKRNAIDGPTLDALEANFAKIASDRSARVVLLRGEGPVFCAGVDFAYLASLGQVDDAIRGPHMREGIARIQSVINRMERLEKPIIALIHGLAVGLGIELALAADFRIAAATSRMGFPQVVMGLIPDCGGTTRLTRTVGPALAKELIMFGELIPADRALAIGLVNRVVPDDALESAGVEWAAKLIGHHPSVLGLAKRAITWGAGTDAMTHMEIEAYVQSALVSQKDFPNIFMQGVAKLQQKKK